MVRAGSGRTEAERIGDNPETQSRWLFLPPDTTTDARGFCSHLGCVRLRMAT